MATYETYSKRKRRAANAGKADVYSYDELPRQLRIQIIHILSDSIGNFMAVARRSATFYQASDVWTAIHDTLVRERGEFLLIREALNPAESCCSFLLNADVDDALDLIEIAFRAIDFVVRGVGDHARSEVNLKLTADEAIDDLNARFREHGVGFQYVDGAIVLVNSQFIHAEAVKPALVLLHEAGFDGPSEEFMSAFRHYRNGEYKQSIAEALKAFESTLKSICDSRNWPYPTTATALPLVRIVFEKGIVPHEMQSHFDSLRTAMESGLPTLSNRNARHGQGADPVSLPPHIAAFALHLTASNIVFLVQSHKALK